MRRGSDVFTFEIIRVTRVGPGLVERDEAKARACVNAEEGYSRPSRTLARMRRRSGTVASEATTTVREAARGPHGG